MSRTFHLLVIILVCLTVSAAALAQETQDERLVREVLERELKGALEGKPEQVKSCYAPGFVGYTAMTAPRINRLHTQGIVHYADPEDWEVGITTPEELDEYAEASKGYPERRAKSDVEHDNEVVSVRVKGDFAIGVTRHWSRWQDKTTNENVMGESRTVWMLKKLKGEWKIFTYVGQVSWGQLRYKSTPQ